MKHHTLVHRYSAIDWNGKMKNQTTKLTFLRQPTESIPIDIGCRHTLTSVDLVAYLKYNVEDDSVMDRLALVRSIYVFVLID